MNSLQCKGFRLRRPPCHLARPPHPASFSSRVASAAAGRSELRAHCCMDMRAAGAEAGLGIQLATAEPLHAANSTQGEPWHAGFAGVRLARCQHGVDDATGQPKQNWRAKSPLRHPRAPCRSTRAANSFTTTDHATRTASAIVASSTPAHAQRQSPASWPYKRSLAKVPRHRGSSAGRLGAAPEALHGQRHHAAVLAKKRSCFCFTRG